MDNFNFCIGIVDLHERSDDDYYKVDVIFDDDECESRLKNFDTSVNPDTYNFENLPMIFDVCYSAIRSTNISLRIKAFDCILTCRFNLNI